MKDNAHSHSNKLLLIDDDPNLILLVRDYLEFRGYQVFTAENGLEALDILEQDIPDMIICDVMMPEMDGYTFVGQIRNNPRTDSIPVMFLSAFGQSQDRVKGLNMGGDVYMVKPFEPEELVAQVKSTLKLAKRLREYSNSQRLDIDKHIRVPSADVTLTPRELKVVNLVAQGMGNREIATRLKVSQRTIESHVSNMLNKTQLSNRTELARWAIESKIVL